MRAYLYGAYYDLPGGDVVIPNGYMNIYKHIWSKIENKVKTVINMRTAGKIYYSRSNSEEK